MGWSSGTDIAEVMIDLCQEFVPLPSHKPFLTRSFQVLEAMDWDTPHDVYYDSGRPEELTKIIREILNEAHPDWFGSEEDEEETVKH